MPLTNEKIEAIRKACIAHQSSIGFRLCNEGTKHDGICSGYCIDGSFFGDFEQEYREVRLVDVLNALMHTDHVVCIASNERFELFDKEKNQWVQQFKTWYFSNDDLSAQGPDTIDFIYDIIK